MTPETAIDRVADAIARGERILFSIGKGLDSESGTASPEEDEQFCINFPALAKEGINYRKAASLETLKADPALGWGFYGDRLGLPGFNRSVWSAIAEIAGRCGWLSYLSTSETDGKLRCVGLHADLEHHGNIGWLQCAAPCLDDIWPNLFRPEIDGLSRRLTCDPPSCPRCGGMARPNLLMPDDTGWVSTRTKSQMKYVSKLMREYPPSIILEIGGCQADDDLRAFGNDTASEFGAPVFRVGLNCNEFGSAAETIQLKPSEALGLINLRTAHLPHR